MKVRITFFLFLFSIGSAFAQTGTIKGKVTDKNTGESLIGVNVVYDVGKGTVSDIEGNYSLQLEYGKYELIVSYVGFEKETKPVTINSSTKTLNFQLKYKTLVEVEIIGDMAKTRETPVAFSTIEAKKLDEELASQDIPLLLNSTPGVYATQQGGGDGDSRINIRGFNQRNVAVMLDGIPVNDMENGWVYWSNWFGLDVVMRKTQIQRGLGASKLAIPSVGGTINIQTKGIGAKKGIVLKQEVGGDGYLRSSIGITSGQLKNGWGITAAGSYKRGNGWVDNAWTKGWFYFLRIDKNLGNHRLSFKAMGAPQSHGQRSYKKSIAVFDSAYAVNHGVEYDDFTSNMLVDLGIKYNPNWGVIDRYTFDSEGNKLSNGIENISEKMNYYHKPMFSISDFWNVNDKLYISNIAYLSIGNGGGTGLKSTPNILPNGQVNFQAIYDGNNYHPIINPNHESTGILRSSINNHFWYGLLSAFSFKITDKLNLSGGLDLRSYRGEHYREIYDLLGGNYFTLDNENENDSINKKKYVGDIIGYHNDGLVAWGGLFSQLEYSSGNLTAFINLTASYCGYKRIDYFKPKVLELSDTTLNISYETVIDYNGETYDRNSPGLEFITSPWKWIPGGTIKGGVNYNLNENMNIFTNIGYISKAPRFNNVYDYNNTLFREIKNEKVKAFEIGYSYFNSKITFNFNAYITEWENKPSEGTNTIMINDEPYKVNVNGMNALHKGVELEFAWKIFENLKLESLLSVGDWKWLSADSARLYDDNLNLKDVIYFDAAGIFVGDAAQIQNRESVRWEIFKDFYFTGAITYFGKHYSDFNPLDLDPEKNDWAFNEDGTPKQSWKIPDYYLVDLHIGYGFFLKDVKLNLRASILNLLDETYISDANNNDGFSGQSFNGFDARSSAVFFGLGRRYNISLQLSF